MVQARAVFAPDRPRLVGRAKELGQLEAAIARVRGGTGHVVLVEGEAGIGKSRLVGEVRASAEQFGCLVVQAACFESDRIVPYAPIADLVRSLLIAEPSVVSTSALRTLAPDLLSAFPELGECLPDVVPAPILQPGAEKPRLLHAVRRLLEAAAADRPLMVVVEDLHWADDASSEVLSFLVRSTPTSHFLLVLTARPQDEGTALSRLLVSLEREGRATRLALGPFTLTEVELLVRHTLGLTRPVPAELLHLVFSLTSGNPFFVEEILRTLLPAGAETWDRRALDLQKLRVPRTIQQAVDFRVARLEEHARRVLELAATIGQTFEFGLLQELAGCDEGQLVHALKDLVRSRLVTETSTDQFMFEHALTREAVYMGLVGRERRALHERIASLVEARAAPTGNSPAAALSYHFHAAANWAKTLEYASRAGHDAYALHAPYTAIEHYNHAIEAAGELGIALPAALVHGRGRAYELVGDFEAARADYESALNAARAADDRHHEWQALVSLGMLWTWRDYQSTGAYFREALGLARAIGDSALVAESLNRVGNWHLNQDQADEAVAHHRRALSTFEQLQSERGIAETLGLLAMSSYLGADLERGTDYCERAISAFRALCDRQGEAESVATLALGTTTMTTDTCVAPIAPVAAALRVEGAVSLAREIGWRAGEAFAQFNLAYCLAASGEYDGALAAAEACVNIAEEIEHGEWTTAGLAVVGGIHRDLLDFERARHYLVRALDNARVMGATHWISETAALLAPVLAEQRHFHEAEATLALAHAYGLPAVSLAARNMARARAEVAIAAGRSADALTILDHLLDSARGGSTAKPILRLHLLRAEVLATLGRAGDAEAVLEQLAVEAALSGLQPLLWRILIALGRTQAAQRRHGAAAASYDRARAAIQQLSAPLESNQTLRDLFVAAAESRIPRHRPPTARQAAQAAFGGLTRREREVATLVARARTNAEIASDLVLGQRTVETHIENIRTKLGLASRREVAVWALEHGLS